MRSAVRMWSLRVGVVVALQAAAALPLVLGARGDSASKPSGEKVRIELPVGRFKSTMEAGAPERKKTLYVDVVALLDGTGATDAAKRAAEMMPRIHEVVREEVSRVDAADAATLRGRERLRAEIRRSLSAILRTDDLREVLFESYHLD